MSVINKIIEGINEYYIKTGHNPSKITITKHVLNKIRNEQLCTFPRLEKEKDRARNQDLKICGILVCGILGNSTAITYE